MTQAEMLQAFRPLSVVSVNAFPASVQTQENVVLTELKELKECNSKLLQKIDMLKVLIEAQFRLAHATDIPFHFDRKWSEYKFKHDL